MFILFLPVPSYTFLPHYHFCWKHYTLLCLPFPFYTTFTVPSLFPILGPLLPTCPLPFVPCPVHHLPTRTSFPTYSLYLKEGLVPVPAPHTVPTPIVPPPPSPFPTFPCASTYPTTPFFTCHPHHSTTYHHHFPMLLTFYSYCIPCHYSDHTGGMGLPFACHQASLPPPLPACPSTYHAFQSLPPSLPTGIVPQNFLYFPKDLLPHHLPRQWGGTSSGLPARFRFVYLPPPAHRLFCTAIPRTRTAPPDACGTVWFAALRLNAPPRHQRIPLPLFSPSLLPAPLRTACCRFNPLRTRTCAFYAVYLLRCAPVPPSFCLNRTAPPHGLTPPPAPRLCITTTARLPHTPRFNLVGFYCLLFRSHWCSFRFVSFSSGVPATHELPTCTVRFLPALPGTFGTATSLVIGRLVWLLYTSFPTLLLQQY